MRTLALSSLGPLAHGGVLMRTLALSSLGIVALALAGCTATLPDGVFRCSVDTDCPGDLRCVASLCRRSSAGVDTGVVDTGVADTGVADGSFFDAGLDAGTDAATTDDAGMDAGLDLGVDAGAIDGGSDAALDAFAPVDAGSCTPVADCVTLTVTNAYGGLGAGLVLSIEGRDVTFPDFGGTTPSFDVPLGGDGSLDIDASVLGTLHLPATGHSIYALIAGHDPASGASTPVIRLLPASFVAPGAGMVHVRALDMLQDTGTMRVSAPAPTPPQDITTTVDGAVLPIIVGGRPPLVLRRHDLSPVASTTLAAFDVSEWPQTGAYYVVFVGRTDAHLASSSGLRAIPVVPGEHAHYSLPVVTVLNSADGQVEACYGTQSLGVIAPNTLLEGIAGFDTTTPAGMGGALTIYDARSATGCTGTVSRPAQVPLVMAEAETGRALVAVIGTLASGNWGAGASIEAPPSTAVQLVTYGNGTLGGTLTFSSTGSPATRAMAAALGSTSIAWPSRPIDLTIDFGGGPRTFVWDPTASTAAVIAVTDGTLFAAYEMNTPFGRDWTLTIRPGT